MSYIKFTVNVIYDHKHATLISSTYIYGSWQYQTWYNINNINF